VLFDDCEIIIAPGSSGTLSAFLWEKEIARYALPFYFLPRFREFVPVLAVTQYAKHSVLRDAPRHGRPCVLVSHCKEMTPS
jgi:hypothetical protein